MNGTVNVIYTGGTLAALSRFVPLLVQHTPWRFRLVGNHCSPAERDLLAWYAAADDRLSVHHLDVAEVIPLGKALCALLDLDGDDEVFAFMDSDIVVTGDVAADLEPLLSEHHAVFSGAAIWAQPADQVLTAAHTEVAGPHCRTDTGIALGSSYFGLFRRATLNRVRRECRVTPDKYTDVTSCAPAFQRFLADHGLLRRDYVPPKLLTLGYTHLGLPVIYQESAHLHHIGGYTMANYHAAVDALPAGEAPANAAEILDYTDHRPHMARKIAVCRRLSTAFADIDNGVNLRHEPTFPPPLEQRVRLIEETYAAQTALQTDRPAA